MPCFWSCKLDQLFCVQPCCKLLGFFHFLLLHTLYFSFFNNLLFFPPFFLFLSFHFVSLKSHSSELLFTPTPPPLPSMRPALSPELQAVTSEWISLTLGPSSSSTPTATPPLPPLPDASLYNIDYLIPSAVASPSPSISLYHSNFSSSSTPRSIISPLSSCPSGPPSSAQNPRLLTPQSEEKLVSSPSPHLSYCHSPYSLVGSPDSFLSELSDVLDHQRSRGAGRSFDREDWISADKDCSGTPVTSQGRCPSDLEKGVSPQKKSPYTFENKLNQEQGNGPQRRDYSNYKQVEQKESQSRAFKVLCPACTYCSLAVYIVCLHL